MSTWPNMAANGLQWHQLHSCKNTFFLWFFNWYSSGSCGVKNVNRSASFAEFNALTPILCFLNTKMQAQSWESEKNSATNQEVWPAESPFWCVGCRQTEAVFGCMRPVWIWPEGKTISVWVGEIGQLIKYSSFRLIQKENAWFLLWSQKMFLFKDLFHLCGVSKQPITSCSCFVRTRLIRNWVQSEVFSKSHFNLYCSILHI